MTDRMKPYYTGSDYAVAKKLKGFAKFMLEVEGVKESKVESVVPPAYIQSMYTGKYGPCPRLETNVSNLMQTLDSDHQEIMAVFSWTQTPQGHIYWNEVYDNEGLTPEARDILEEWLAYHLDGHYQEAQGGAASTTSTSTHTLDVPF